MEIKIRYVAVVPQSSSEDDINFHRNEGSFCLNNDINQIHEESNQENGICHICNRAETTYLREATEDDHKELSWLNKVEH
jgi:queuine/archaeosine tRNA-ribosyltransferase